MNEYVWETCEELDKKIADRVRLIRKRRSISQEKLSKISNVSLGSIKRFETTGQISLLSLTKIAVALNIADDLRNIFTEIPCFNQNDIIHAVFQNALCRVFFPVHNQLRLLDHFSVLPSSRAVLQHHHRVPA